MPITCECDCGRRLRVADEKAGKKIRCPDCSEVVVIPQSQKPARSSSAKKTGRPLSARSSAGKASQLPPSRSRKRSPAQQPRKTTGQYSTAQKAVIVTALLAIFGAGEYARRLRQPARPKANSSSANVASKPVLSLEEETLALAKSRYVAWQLPAATAVRVLSKFDISKSAAAREELKEITGKVKAARVTHSFGIFMAEFDGPDLEDLSSKITFGKVIKVDKDTRTIFVLVPAEPGGSDQIAG